MKQVKATMLDTSGDSTDSNFIWLPTLKVWGFFALSRHSSQSKRSKDPGASSSSPLGTSTEKNRSVMSQNLTEEALSPSTCLGPSGKSADLMLLEQMQSSGKSLGNEVDQELVCPICLGAIEDGRHAVLWGCMHRFCIDCLEEWSRVRRSCPLCKAEYCGWNQASGFSGEIEKRCLPPLEFRPSFCLEDYRPSVAESEFSTRTSISHRTLERLGSGREVVRNTLTFRSRLRLQQLARARSVSRCFRRCLPLPRQRCFGPSVWPTTSERESVAVDAAAERVLRWRSSIYKRGLKARPFQMRKADGYHIMLSDPDAKLRAKQRLEPWIYRELQAVLGNSDPSLLARHVLSLWFAYTAKVAEKMQEIVDSEGENAMTTEARKKTRMRLECQLSETAIQDLKYFLGEEGPLFWHELRCFAESPFTLNTYDSIVIYSRPKL
ncbi:hypothetical protein O6H91_06G040700 [Diphasiastrum complanatum]|uniref:Uncharacterized protein n=2 Tax=Diphasiastrum complanatum TaxID=34168 RepID=A0ACC2DCL5_DIPCM|nr:hypothetical protein O6H91_06G040700 [Diphasiastrum complanatum]KAJ7552074.1 hypothetical protein O6H91_06G040700 [Diphasiastrum complanatum]